MTIDRILKIQVLLSVVAIAGALVMRSQPILLGVVLGVTVATVNILGLRQAFRFDQGTRGMGIGAVLNGVKWIAVMTGVYFAFKHWTIHPIAFVGGISVTVVALVVAFLASTVLVDKEGPSHGA